jgi:hypothetical protein
VWQPIARRVCNSPLCVDMLACHEHEPLEKHRRIEPHIESETLLTNVILVQGQGLEEDPERGAEGRAEAGARESTETTPPDGGL